MRIAIATVQVPFVTGGAEAHAEGLRRALLAEGHEAEIVTFPFNPSVPDRLPEQMLACSLIDLREIHGTRIDRVIALKFPAYLIPHPNKVVWLLHQHRAAYDLWNYPFEDLDAWPRGHIVREAIRRADAQLGEARAVFANSKTIARRLAHFCRVVSTPLYHPPPQAEAFFCASETEDYFFFPSRLSATKRQSLVLEALALTKQPVRVRFSGAAANEEYLGRLQELAQKLGVAGRVQWLGMITEEEKRETYAKALAVIFPPLDEDYGYVTLEAMLSAKAVITCDDSGGPLEFVGDRETGLIAKPTAENLAVSLDQLWADRALAAKYGRAGRAAYDALGLSWAKVIAQLLA
ncbi:MAG: glycosyltransferase family 4 protein [Chthoniobacterales bacterium]